MLTHQRSIIMVLEAFQEDFSRLLVKIRQWVQMMLRSRLGEHRDVDQVYPRL